jgi:hypothetical protein
MSVVLVCAAVALASKLLYKENHSSEYDPLIDFKREAHKYSGIHPETYLEFLSKLNLAQQHATDDVRTSQRYMLEAIDQLEDLGLHAESGDLSVQDEIHSLSKRIGYEFERILMTNAINKKGVFYPKYLNNRIE